MCPSGVIAESQGAPRLILPVQVSPPWILLVQFGPSLLIIIVEKHA